MSPVHSHRLIRSLPNSYYFLFNSDYLKLSFQLYKQNIPKEQSKEKKKNARQGTVASQVIGLYDSIRVIRILPNSDNFAFFRIPLA